VDAKFPPTGDRARENAQFNSLGKSSARTLSQRGIRWQAEAARRPTKGSTTVAKSRRTWVGKDVPGIDFNLSHRVLFALTVKYQKGTIGSYWNIPLHRRLMEDLAANTVLRDKAFKLVPQAIEEMAENEYAGMYSVFSRYAGLELSAWFKAGVKRARSMGVLDANEKPSERGFQDKLAGWLKTHTHPGYETQREKVRLLGQRLSYLRDRKRYFGQFKSQEKIEARLQEDKRYYERFFRQLAISPLKQSKMTMKHLGNVNHHRPWMTIIELTDSGDTAIASALKVIHERMKQQFVDGQLVYFDPVGLANRHFRFPMKTDGRRPHLFRVHRYRYKDKTVIDHYVVRLGKVLTQMLVTSSAFRCFKCILFDMELKSLNFKHRITSV